MNTEQLERVFELFETVHTPEEGSESGIGLALCQRIVKRHGVRPNSERPGSTDERSESVGGEIWVESEPGEGTTFSFTIPFAEDQQSMSVPSSLTYAEDRSDCDTYSSQ